MITKIQSSKQRKRRVRSRIGGTTDRPRLCVRISLHHVSAQVIDDTTGKTLVSATTVGQKEAKGTLTQKAAWVGEQVGTKAKAAKIKSVVFDRGSRLYRGRLSTLATAARNQGLEF